MMSLKRRISISIMASVPILPKSSRAMITLDENRPASVERRRKTNQRTTRENVAHLADEGSFVEYGSLAIAAQRRRRKVDDPTGRTLPADGLITGVATGSG